MHLDVIMSFVEDILRFIDSREEKDYETNQHFAGMQELFRGHVVVAWEELN